MLSFQLRIRMFSKALQSKGNPINVIISCNGNFILSVAGRSV